MVQRCGGCGAHLFIPRSFCPVCRSTDLSWVPTGGRGAIVTYTVVGRAQTPAFTTPYVVAVVRLDEGCEMMTNIVDCTPDEVTIGAPVEVSWLPVDADITLPCFRLVAPSTEAPAAV